MNARIVGMQRPDVSANVPHGYPMYFQLCTDNNMTKEKKKGEKKNRIDTFLEFLKAWSSVLCVVCKTAASKIQRKAL